MSTKRLLKVMIPFVLATIMLAMLLTGCSSDSENKLITIEDPVEQAVYYIQDSKLNQYYQDHTTKEQAVNEFTDSITALRTYLDGESFVDTGYYMGVNYDIDLLDEEDNTAGNFQLRVNAYLYTYPYEDEDGNPIYKYYENGNYYDENNAEGTRTLVNALEIHNEAIKKSDISIEWYNGATNEVMIGLYFDGLNSNSDDPGNILYVDIQGGRRSFPEFGDTVLYQQLIRLLVHLSVEGLLSSLGLQSDAGTSTINEYMIALIGENYKRTVNDDIVSLLFYAITLDVIKDKATDLLVRLFGTFRDKWDPLTYKYLGFRFSSVANATVQTILADMQADIAPDKNNVNNVLTNAVFHLTGVVRDRENAPYHYTCDVSFDYGWVYPDIGLGLVNKDWYKEFDYGNYEFKGKLYVPSWDSQFDALIRTDMNPDDNTINNVFIEFRDIANGELAIGVYYKNERSYLDITGLEYMYGWIDLEYLGFPQVYDEHLDLAHVLKRFKIMIGNVIVSIVDSILDPATSDKKNKALEYIIAKTSMTEKIEFSTEDERAYREEILSSRAVAEIREAMKEQYDDNYIREYIEEYVYNAVLKKKQESLFSANTETLLVDIELIKQMLEETGAGTFTTRQLINVIDSVIPYTMDQLAIMLGIPSAELMIEKTYFTFTLDVDTNLMTMIMYTNLGIEPGEPSNMMWKLELTPTHFGEAVPIAEVNFDNFKPLEQIYTYSGTLKGDFVFSSQETVDLSKLLSATIGESSGLNTPYVLPNNTGLTFTLIYDQFVTDNYVNDDGETVEVGDPTGVWKREGRSAFDMTLRTKRGMDEGDATIIIRLSSDDVSFNNDMYKQLNDPDPVKRSEAEHAMGYIWVSIECVYKNGQQAIPKVKIREDVFMASMSAYMNGETSISDDVSSFADNDFNLSLTSIISALCKDAYVVPEPEQLEITSSNDTLQSLFRVKGLIGNIKVDAGFTYRVKGLLGIKKNYYMYQVGSFKDITGLNPYTTELHKTLNTHFYQDYRDEYEPLDYDFFVYPEDVLLDDGTLIEEGTIMVFELGAKKTITRQPIRDTLAANSFYTQEGDENQDITAVRFALSDLDEIVAHDLLQNKYYYTTYYNKRVEIDENYIREDADEKIYIYWQGIRDIVFYDEGETYYYFDLQKALAYTENDEENNHRIGDYVYLYKAEYRRLLFEYDPASVEVTAYCKTQYAPRTNGSFMGETRRYYLRLTSLVSAELGAMHSVYYDKDHTTWPPQYYSDEDANNVVSVYDDDGKLIDMYYDPIALFVMEPAEPLATSYQFNVCTDPNRKTGIESWTPESETPHVRSKWELSEIATFNCRFVIDWSRVTLKGYFVVTEVIVAEGMMGETIFPCRIIVTNREVETNEYASLFDKDNYRYIPADPGVAVPGEEIPEKTYYVHTGDDYVLTADRQFVEGTVYYTLEYYEANVPVVDSISIDPYEYLLSKYAYLSDTNNFNPAGYGTKERYLDGYKKAEEKFIISYFSQFAFDINFAWEVSELYRAKVEMDYIAQRYTNWSADGKRDDYDWLFDSYLYGNNIEKIIKPAGGTVYIHTRFHGQLIALRVDIGVRNFSHVKFNVYNADGSLAREDTFTPGELENIQGKYSANYYDSSSYVIGTEPTFVFTDDRGQEHEIVFNMAYIKGLNESGNYNVDPSYQLRWDYDAITNVGTEGSYFMEYVYSALYASDSPTEEVGAVTKIYVDYEEGLTATQKDISKVVVGGGSRLLYRDYYGNGTAYTLKTVTYGTETVPLLSYANEKIAYRSLSDAMKAERVTVYNATTNDTYETELYVNEGGYAYVRVAYEYSSDYVPLVRYGLLPMGSDNYSLVLSTVAVSYSDTGSNLALTEEQKSIRVTAEGNTKSLYADTDKNGYAEKLIAIEYHDRIFDPVTTYKGELVPYKSLSLTQQVQKVRTESGELDLLYHDVDGHAEIRRATRYKSAYAPYTMPAFKNYSEFTSYFVSYSDLTDAEKAQKEIVDGVEVDLYAEIGGYAEKLVPEYKNETEPFLTASGERVYYERLSKDMKNKTVVVPVSADETEEIELYSADPEGYALVLKIDKYQRRYETLVRYDFREVEGYDEDILIYNEFTMQNLFRLYEGTVQIRRADVYLSDASDNNNLVVITRKEGENGQTYYGKYSLGSFTSSAELSRKVTVNGEKEEQNYWVSNGVDAAIRLGYWYTDNEWEDFVVDGKTFSSLGDLDESMRSKQVLVRKGDYKVDLFRINDDSTGDGYYLDEWEAYKINDIQQNYDSLSDANKNRTVNVLKEVDGSGSYLFRLNDRYYIVETDVLFRSNGGMAEIRKRQNVLEIRKVRTLGTERSALTVSGSNQPYANLTARERSSGHFVESITHYAQLRAGGIYYNDWEIFTIGGTAFENASVFSSSLLSSQATIRPDGIEGKLYKTNPQGYVLVRDTSKVALSEYLRAENLWVEYGVGNAPLFTSDVRGSLSVRSDKKQFINRPFYAYYAEYLNGTKKAVYIGNEYRYEYEPVRDENGNYLTYNSIIRGNNDARYGYITNQAGDRFYNYVPYTAIETVQEGGGVSNVYYAVADFDPSQLSSVNDETIAYKRVDVSLNSNSNNDTAVATVNFYSLFRLFSEIDGDVLPISVVTGEIVEDDIPGAATRTEYPSITARIYVECPKQDPLVLSKSVNDELENGSRFYPSDVIVGNDPISSAKNGYYQIDPLRPETVTLPNAITVNFEGNTKHSFSGLEWYAYYDESSGQGHPENVAGTTIVTKQNDGTYRAQISIDQETTTKVMTRIGNEVSGYKYITVALVVLSKNPIGIDFYKDQAAADSRNAYEIEQHQVITTVDGKTSTTELYYSYYANTFEDITLPGVAVARFSTHTAQYNVEWMSTERLSVGSDQRAPITFKPNTTVHLESDIRDWQTVPFSALEKMTKEQILTEYEGWVVDTVYRGLFYTESYRGRTFVGDICELGSDGKQHYDALGTYSSFDSIKMYRKVSLTIYLDVVVDNYSLDGFVAPAASQQNSDFFTSDYVMVKEEGFAPDGSLVIDRTAYRSVADLVQWSLGSRTEAGLYYTTTESVDINNVATDVDVRGYVVISEGKVSDMKVAAGKIGLFSRRLRNGETTYELINGVTPESFINSIFDKADITITQHPFDYALPYDVVEVYTYNRNNPTDNSMKKYAEISRIELTFSEYVLAEDKSYFILNKTMGTDCINVENGLVKVADSNRTHEVYISFSDLISMVVANELKKDVRNWTVSYVTSKNGDISYLPDPLPLSAYDADVAFGTDFRSLTLRNEQGREVTYSREELSYRQKYLDQHVSIASENVERTIRNKNVRVNNLENILNVNDLIAYQPSSGNPVPMTKEKYQKGKYLIQLGTGIGSYDIDAVMIFRGGLYYVDSPETINIVAYDDSGVATYASGYNLGDNVQIKLSGVKEYSGASYSAETTEEFNYGSSNNGQKLENWYVVDSNVLGVVKGTVINAIPAESIYRTGNTAAGIIDLATVTPEGFYISRRFSIEFLPDEVDNETLGFDFYGLTGSSSVYFEIEDGVISIENIYEYDNEIGLDGYLSTPNYLPKTVVLTKNRGRADEKRITVNNVSWRILEREWTNTVYKEMNSARYRGTENIPQLFAEAYILGFRSSALDSMQGQIRLVVKMQITSAEIELLPWSDDDIGLSTDIYYGDDGSRRFVVYVDAYNDADSSLMKDGRGVFTLPESFAAYTIDDIPFVFSNVYYSFNRKRVTKIYYDLKGIDVEKMTAPGAELVGSGVSDIRSLRLYADIGLDQSLDMTFYFYDKEATITEAVMSIADESIRKRIDDLISEDKTGVQNDLLQNINVKRVKANLETLMSEAQKIQSGILNSVLPSAEDFWGSSNAPRSEEAIKRYLYADMPSAPVGYLPNAVEYSKVRVWNVEDCHTYALYFVKDAAVTLAPAYAKLIYDIVGRAQSNETKRANISRILTQYAAAYAERAYNNMIQTYMEREFVVLFNEKYMKINVNTDSLNDSIRYKNAVEGLFDTEGLLNDIRKLRRLVAMGSDVTSLRLYVKQFDLTCAMAYGYLDESNITVSSFYRALIIEQIYKAVFAADEQFGLRNNGRFQRSANAELLQIRQTVIELVFARMGILPKDGGVSYYKEYKLIDADSYDVDSVGLYRIVNGVKDYIEAYYLDQNGFMKTGVGPEGVDYYEITERVACDELTTIGAYAGTYIMPVARNVTLNDLVAVAADDGYPSKETRSAINAVVERWFDLTEVSRTGGVSAEVAKLIGYLNGLRTLMIKYSFTSIGNYGASVSTLRRSLVNGTDFSSTLNNLFTKAIDNFLADVYAEGRKVVAIRQARNLNKEGKSVFLLPTESSYRNYTDYYDIRRATEDDFNAGNAYEMSKDSYFFKTTDIDYSSQKYYYAFDKRMSEMRYLPVRVVNTISDLSELTVFYGTEIVGSYYEKTDGGEYVPADDGTFKMDGTYYYLGDALKFNASIATETVYEEDNVVQFGLNDYYRFIEVSTVRDDQVEVVNAGQNIVQADIGACYEYNRGQNCYYQTEDETFNMEDRYYRFFRASSYSAGENYYRVYMGDRYQAVQLTESTFVPDVYYYYRPVHVVSTADTVVVKIGRPVSGDGAIGYRPRVYDSYYQTYVDSSTFVHEYYERRSDGKFYLTEDEVFTQGHVYYSKLLLRKDVDYVQGDGVAGWQERINPYLPVYDKPDNWATSYLNYYIKIGEDYVRNTVAEWKTDRQYYTKNFYYYKAAQQSAVYVKAALYLTDTYYLYNDIPSVYDGRPSAYNVYFDETYGGPSYRYSVAWTGNTLARDADYQGGNAELTVDMSAGSTGDTQKLNQKLAMEGHILAEGDLVVRDTVGELGLDCLIAALKDEQLPDTTGYDVDVLKGTYTVVFRRQKDNRIYRITYSMIGAANEYDKYYLSVMDVYDSEGYLLYRFKNTVSSLTKELIGQSVSVYNPFEFKQSDLPSIVRVDGEYLDIVWKSISILPTGNLAAESPVITGNIVGSKGQEIEMELYVAQWNYAGLYQPTEQRTSVSRVIDGVTRYFVYINPIGCYFSSFATHSAIDCYLVDISIKILSENGVKSNIRLTKTNVAPAEMVNAQGKFSTVGVIFGTAEYTDMNSTSSTEFLKKIFYPYASKAVGGVDYSSRRLEYGTDDSTMQEVLTRRNYLLYWDINTLAGLLGDARHAPREGTISLGNENVGTFTLSGLKEASDKTSPVTATYYFESMNIATLQLSDSDTVVTKSGSEYKIDMPYFGGYYTVDAPSSGVQGGTCSFGHALSFEQYGKKYVVRCSNASCALHDHGVIFDPATGESEYEWLVGRSGQVKLIMDAHSFYPETGLITLAENNVKYDMSELKVRLLWNQSFEDVIANMKLFVSEKYPDVDSSARENFAVNLFMEFPTMSADERLNVINLAKDYFKTRNAHLRESYTDKMAENDAYRLLAIGERYDFVANPDRLAGGGDSGVTVTVFVLAEGNVNIYRQQMSVRVLFSDYTPQGYYSYYQTPMSENYNVVDSINPYLNNSGSSYERFTVPNSMNGKTVPQGAYFEKNVYGEYVLTTDMIFNQSKTYYRLKTDTIYIKVLAEYWNDAENKNSYEESGREAPYDNPEEDVYILLDYIWGGRMSTERVSFDNVKFKPYEEDGKKYRMVELKDVYWKYDAQAGLLTSDTFVITANGNEYKITSALLTMSLA